MPDTAPAGYTFPTQADYAVGLVQAVNAAAPLATASDASFSPPMRAHVAAVGATIESATGLPLGELAQLAGSVSTLASATDPAVIAAAVRDLVSGTLQVAVASAQAAGAALSGFEAVPVIGQFIDIVAGIVIGIFESQARYAAAEEICQNRWNDWANEYCAKAVNAARPTPTSSKGPTPADMFRPMAYQDQRIARGGSVTHLPMSAASVYVVICGNALPTSYPSKWRAHVSGIPLATRRQAWQLIRGIMAAAERPGLQQAPVRVGDSGRTLYPILQELMRQAWLRGQLTDAQIRVASDIVTGSLGKGDYCPDITESELAAGATPYGYASCKGDPGQRRVDLADPFVSGLTEFQNMLFDAFKDSKGNWKTTPSYSIKLPATAALWLNTPALKRINAAATRPTRVKRAVVGASTATILGAAAALGATLL